MRKTKIILALLAYLFSFTNAEDYKSFISSLNLDLEEVTVVTKDRYVNTIWAITSNDSSNRNGRSVFSYFRKGFIGQKIM